MKRRDLLAGVAALALLGRPAGAEGLASRPLPRQPRPFDPVSGIAHAGLGAASVAWAVRDAATGEMLAQRAADIPVPPASTLKAVTAAYALHRLGPGHRFVTRALLDGERLILAGGGDPTLDSDRLADLARAVAASGVRPKALAVWGGALPRMEQISAGQPQHVGYNPSLSGMILNFNRVHLDWRARAGGLSLQARARQQSPRAWTIRAEAVPRRSPTFAHDALPDGERWTIARSALAHAGSRWLPVRLPELYGGDVFQTLCRAEGLPLPAPEVIETLPQTAREVASVLSPPLPDVLHDMLEFSTNITAEAVGLAASGAGDIAASAGFMQDWLQGRGLAPGAVFSDHSGLSAGSHVGAAALSAVMADRHGVLEALLPAISSEAGIRIAAKTGTLNFVSNLAGLARGTSGRPLAFAILITDPVRHAATDGAELPEGVLGWTARAKALQLRLVEDWATRLG